MTYTLTCYLCGAKVYRHYNLKSTKCEECKRVAALDYKNAKNRQTREGPNSPCYTCDYYHRCKRDLWKMAEVPGDGQVIVPLMCFADHPHYRAEEWRQRVEG